jgi:hypothetical protein
MYLVEKVHEPRDPDEEGPETEFVYSDEEGKRGVRKVRLHGFHDAVKSLKDEEIRIGSACILQIEWSSGNCSVVPITDKMKRAFPIFNKYPLRSPWKVVGEPFNPRN